MKTLLKSNRKKAKRKSPEMMTMSPIQEKDLTLRRQTPTTPRTHQVLQKSLSYSATSRKTVRSFQTSTRSQSVQQVSQRVFGNKRQKDSSLVLSTRRNAGEKEERRERHKWRSHNLYSARERLLPVTRREPPLSRTKVKGRKSEIN